MKNGGQIPWNVFPICETFKVSCPMGRHHVKGGSEYHLADQLSRLEQWSNVTLFLLFGPKVLPGFFLGYVCCPRGESGKETYWSQIVELEEMDASELHARRLNAKKC